MQSDRRAYLQLTHEFSVWLINLADTKASILAGGAAVFLALIVNRGHPANDFPGLLLLLGVSLVMMSVLSALVCLWPRVGRPTSNPLFFASVAKMSLDEYEKAVLGEPERDLAKDLAEENHALARIQSRKYQALRLATGLLFVGILLVAVGWALGPPN